MSENNVGYKAMNRYHFPCRLIHAYIKLLRTAGIWLNRNRRIEK